MRGHAAAGLKNTLILLLLFQLLRFISIKTQGKELVCPARVGRRDTFDNRLSSIIDGLLFLVYFGSTILLVLYDINE